MQILIDTLLPQAAALCRQAFADREVNIVSYSQRQPSAAQLAQTEALWIRSVTRVDAELLAQAPKLRWVGSGTIGCDHVDQAALAAAGVTFVHTPGVNAAAVGDYVLSAVAAVALERQQLPAGEVAIIGAGHTGQAAAQRLRALGLAVHYYDPPLLARDPAAAVRLGVHGDWQRVLQAAVISCHVPLTRSGPHATWHLFDQAALAALRRDTLLINAARGGVISEQALRQVWVAGQRLQVVLDVWEDEPQVATDLLAHVHFATAHIAGHSVAGKLAASWQLAQRCAAAFGSQGSLPPLAELLAAQHLKQLPQPLQAASLPWQALASEVLSLYDIRDDDLRLRQQGLTPSGFDALRRTYPARVELTHAGLTFEDAEHHGTDL